MPSIPSLYNFLFLCLFFSHFSLSDQEGYFENNSQFVQKGQNSFSDYTCKIDEECLDHLHNVLLDKEANRGIYQYCQISLDNIKLCCADPSQCQESWGKNRAKELRDNSLTQVQESGGDILSCELNKLSGLIASLSGTLNNVCETGLKNCEIECENKLDELKQSFRRCFSVSDNYSIEELLKKAENPIKDQSCYKEMKKVKEKYKKQSLNGKALLREELKAKDIVNCKEVESVKTKANLNKFALNMCHQAQEQKKEEEERLKQEKLEESKQQAKQREAEQKAQALSPPTSSQSKGSNNLTKVLPLAVGAGVLATAKTSKAQPKGKVRAKKKRQAKKKPLTQAKTSSLSNVKGSIGKNQARKEKPVLTNPNPRPRGRMERRRESGTERRVSSINSLTGSMLKTSSETPLQVAQANVSSRSCPPSMPEIESVVVYQSVEAPQIEPMNQQKNFPYNDYELVMGKPAGVLVLLDHSIMNRYQEFAMDLLISGNTKLHRKCFHEPMEGEMRGGEEFFCSFKREHLRIEGDYKFFPLPMQEGWLQKNEVTHSVVLTLYPRGYGNKPYCHQKRSFNIKNY